MTVRQSDQDTAFAEQTATDSNGDYYFLSLPRGLYTVRVTKPGYQEVEKPGIELPVGARVVVDFVLPSASPLQGPGVSPGSLFTILDQEPIEDFDPSRSVLVEESKILQLPMVNRNIYSLFLLQPGVTSHGAIATRGLSFSVHGQRVSGSNYRLDEVDNNNIVLTGPVTATSAEAVQEFRMVNSSFTAENGRATAFVAHVVTRGGTNRFHGGVFEYFSNDKLDANTFQNNSRSVLQPPFRQNQFGYSVSGAVVKNKTFFSNVLELSRLRHRTLGGFTLPTAFFIESLPATSQVRQLLTEVPPLPVTGTAADPNIGTIQYQVPNRIDTLLATGRLDHRFDNEKDRLVLRYTLASTEQVQGTGGSPGYPSLQPTDDLRAQNSLVGWTHALNAGQVNDFRVGWSRERIDFPRPRPDLPVLQLESPVLLPGSRRQTHLLENSNVIQFSDTFSARKGRSSITAGFEYRKNVSNSRSLGLQNEALGGDVLVPAGIYLFSDLTALANEIPFLSAIGVDRRSSGALRRPNLERKYRSNEYAGFVQDDVRLAPGFTLSLGIRYEYYGVPHSTDPSEDVNFYFGPGSTIEERLAQGTLRSVAENVGDLEGRISRRDLLNFAPSIGIAWDLFGGGRTILRAGYAVALDRVFDTIRDVRSNSLQTVFCHISFCEPRFLIPAERMLPLLDQELGPAPVVQLDENLRTPYAQNWYVGLQQELTPNSWLEIGHAGSVGRKLISRDSINRFAENPDILDNTFLSNAGNSNYLALEASLRRSFSRGLQFQISYTLSHAIDNQSDVFEGARTSRDSFALASFTRQFDATVDRGNANFDQRHNLVFNAIWDIPSPRSQTRWLNRLFGGWTSSVIGAYRSGFPVTAIASAGLDEIGLHNNRLDFLGGPGEKTHSNLAAPVMGGVQWLDPTLFGTAEGGVGNLGRGAIKGPGFWNYDFAVLKNVVSGGERFRLQFRAEFYNLFNHANLSAPVSLFTESTFGQSFYGLNRTFSRFGDLPLENPSRRIQFALRLQF